MPELPDVEAVRKSLERCCVGKRITDVIAVEQGDGNRENQFVSFILVFISPYTQYWPG